MLEGRRRVLVRARDERDTITTLLTRYLSSRTSTTPPPLPPPPTNYNHIRNLFLLQVHPDFFSSYPRERRINDENLKILNSHLDRSNGGSSSSSARMMLNSSSTTNPSSSSSSLHHLIFYLVKGLPSPHKVRVPLNGCLLTSLSNILNTHCHTNITPPPTTTTTTTSTSTTSSRRAEEEKEEGKEPFYKDGYYNHHRHHKGGSGSYYYYNKSPNPFPSLSSFLSSLDDTIILKREQGALLLQQEIAILKSTWGFKEVMFVREWSCDHLAIVARRLRESLEEYGNLLLRQGSGDYDGFVLVVGGRARGGVVVEEDDGVIGLSPSDPPLFWVEGLLTVGEEERRRRREGELREKALCMWLEKEWKGGGVVVVEQGKTCPKRVYLSCLERWVSEAMSASTNTSSGGSSSTSMAVRRKPIKVKIEHGHR